MGNNWGVSAFLAIAQPTNHLDVDAREALVQALNDYSGAVILISHDRHMMELSLLPALPSRLPLSQGRLPRLLLRCF